MNNMNGYEMDFVELTSDPTIKRITFITGTKERIIVDKLSIMSMHHKPSFGIGYIMFDKGVVSMISLQDILNAGRIRNLLVRRSIRTTKDGVYPLVLKLYDGERYLGKAIIEYLDTDLKKMSDDLFETLVERIDKEYTYGSSDESVLIGCDLTGYDTTPLNNWLYKVNKTCNNFFNSVGGKRLRDRNIHDIIAFHIRCDGNLDNVIDLVLMDSVTGEYVCNICELDVELSEKLRGTLLNFKQDYLKTFAKADNKIRGMIS